MFFAFSNGGGGQHLRVQGVPTNLEGILHTGLAILLILINHNFKRLP